MRISQNRVNGYTVFGLILALILSLTSFGFMFLPQPIEPNWGWLITMPLLVLSGVGFFIYLVWLVNPKEWVITISSEEILIEDQPNGLKWKNTKLKPSEIVKFVEGDAGPSYFQLKDGGKVIVSGNLLIKRKQILKALQTLTPQIAIEWM